MIIINWKPPQGPKKTVSHRLKVIGMITGLTLLLPLMVVLIPVWAILYLVTGQWPLTTYFNLLADTFIQAEE